VSQVLRAGIGHLCGSNELHHIDFEIFRQVFCGLHAASRKHQMQRRLEQCQLRRVPVHHQPASHFIIEANGVEPAQDQVVGAFVRSHPGPRGGLERSRTTETQEAHIQSYTG